MTILVSACLLGIKCKYDGNDNFCPTVAELAGQNLIIPVCPEQLGGLPTPRYPAEISKGKIINCLGEDVTEQFTRGARETLKIAQLCKANRAVLKQNSPSCGSRFIYDGTHQNQLINGTGITAKLLIENGIEVISEHDL
ncbi:MAG: DUF523 domain-containing protein [Candidatus Cloacimonetes bacterium]|nr:DUF523 domain-containing protein [Candidatus Cloacimonadota bacterium]